MVEEKVFSLGKLIAVDTGGQGGLTLHLGLLKILALERHVKSKRPTMLQKGIITFNPIYVKVTHISSILNFSNTQSLVVQVSNIRFNNQSLHLWT